VPELQGVKPSSTDHPRLLHREIQIMPATTSTQNTEEWWINDQTPDSSYKKSEDCDAFLDHLGTLNRSLTQPTRPKRCGSMSTT
jgi:hypothetical protein